MARFVLLYHDWPFPHLDFLLEVGDVLRAWRLPVDFDPTSPCRAQANFDHRRFYLDYEGPVSADRGSVRRWDVGSLIWLSQNAEECEFELQGAKCRGRFRLRRVDEETWELAPQG